MILGQHLFTQKYVYTAMEYVTDLYSISLQLVQTDPGSLPTAASLNVCRSGPWERSVQCRKWTKFTHLSDFDKHPSAPALGDWVTGLRVYRSQQSPASALAQTLKVCYDFFFGNCVHFVTASLPSLRLIHSDSF